MFYDYSDVLGVVGMNFSKIDVFKTSLNQVMLSLKGGWKSLLQFYVLNMDQRVTTEVILDQLNKFLSSKER